MCRRKEERNRGYLHSEGEIRREINQQQQKFLPKLKYITYKYFS